MIYVSGPAIAALTGRHRMSVNESMRMGRYGATALINGIRYADAASVAEFHGLAQFNAAASAAHNRTVFIGVFLSLVAVVSPFAPVPSIALRWRHRPLPRQPDFTVASNASVRC
jgi:hypothetical protein